ncbi:PREDICTED: complement C3-like [Cyprinodon variegatus]|uniref:complement C3-like n=1 Tax=Cyprinodon variegatus TaxID=28743 RepID=UPI000742BA44|nr:PREDICTED: complement C3-like [Cyprinodon variegatus]
MGVAGAALFLKSTTNSTVFRALSSKDAVVKRKQAFHYTKRHGVRPLPPLQPGYPVLARLDNQKTWSTPAELVGEMHYRVFAMWPDMESETDTSITLEIVTPGGVVIDFKTISLRSGIYSGNYVLGNIVSFGNWKVVAKFHSHAAESFTAEFEVKEYVLPSFEVKLLPPPESPFFYVDSKELKITIKATYVFGKEVDGSAYVVFGRISGDEKKSFPNSLQRVPIQSGDGEVKLLREHITENIDELVGSSIYVSVSVLTESGGEMVESELRGIKIVKSPYTIHFKRTPKYFKPGMSFDVMSQTGRISHTGRETGSSFTLTRTAGMEPTAKVTGSQRLTSTGGLPDGNSRKNSRPRTSSSVSELYVVPLLACCASKHRGLNRKDNMMTSHLLYMDDIKLYARSEQDIDSLIHTSRIYSNDIGISFGLDKCGPQSVVSFIPDSGPQSVVFSVPDSDPQSLVSVPDPAGSSLVVTSEPAPEPQSAAPQEPVTGPQSAAFSETVLEPQSAATSGPVSESQSAIPPASVPEPQSAATSDSVPELQSAAPSETVAEPLKRGWRSPWGFLLKLGRRPPPKVLQRRLRRRPPPKSQQKRRCLPSITLLRHLTHGQPPGGLIRLQPCGRPPEPLPCLRPSSGPPETQLRFRPRGWPPIWDVVEQYDTGCTAGGGKDAMNVFYDAGLLFETNFGGTPYRMDVKCPAPTRRKRERTITEVRTTLMSGYGDKLQRDCCLDGMKEIPVSYSCERRTEYILDGLACKQAFLHCCEEMKKQRDERKAEVLHLARSEKDDGYIDREITTRSNFPESWLWNDIQLKCPKDDQNCTIVSTEISKPLPDTITTWQVTGISLSRTHGLCVAKPLEVFIWKPFFIDLKLPYSAVQGEQLEIKAILHNYKDNPISVRIEFKEETSICSVAYKREWFRQEVRVGRQTTRSVPYVIIPMAHGYFPIEIKASVKNSFLSDGIRKTLRVVPKGVLIQEPRKLILDPARKGGRQVEHINSGISMADLVPNTPMDTLISVTGEQGLNTLLDNAISGESMGTLIKEPTGCGEQNMAAMTLPVIAAIYLDKTNQWEAVGFEKRNKAIQHIKSGYEGQLKFRKDDGSFAIFKSYPSTTWLTAYVAKVFSMANNFIHIDSNVLCGAIRFLILKTQQPDGMFVEIGDVYDKNMIGDVGGVDSDASMTAFCLIAMREASGACSSIIDSLPGSMSKAEAYLERRLDKLTNPYAVALTSYALATNNKLNRQILYNFAAQDGSHWPVSKGDIYSLETTAYALLALVKDKFNGINRNVKVTVTGNGEAMFNMVSLYYAVPKKEESDCEMFDLNLELIDEKVTEDERVYMLKIEVLYKNREREASMSILDVGFPTGYTFNKNDLDALSKGHDRIIREYEANKVLSEKGSLIIYLSKVSNTQPEEISFRIEREMKVAILQPAAVSVYEYYNKKRCVKFYRPKRRTGELLKLCQNEGCLCAEENCNKQRKEKISNDMRAEKACESTETSKIDFVYKVIVEDFFDNYTTDSYIVRILETYKEGSTDESPKGNIRTFLSYQHCREALALKPSKTYLFMGSSSDIHRVGSSYMYIISETTWVEYWPTPEECQQEKHRPTCFGMELLIEQIEIFGCNLKRK